jgi:L-ribulokinase
MGVALERPYRGEKKRREITALARKIRPQYLAKCGGTYSSEWFFSKFCIAPEWRPKFFEAAYLWVEMRIGFRRF